MFISLMLTMSLCSERSLCILNWLHPLQYYTYLMLHNTEQGLDNTNIMSRSLFTRPLQELQHTCVILIYEAYTALLKLNYTCTIRDLDSDIIIIIDSKINISVCADYVTP